MSCKLYSLAILLPPLLLVNTAACSGGGKKVQELESDLSDIRSLQADYAADLTDLKTKLREVSGRLEEVEYRVAGKTQQLQQTLEQFSRRVPPPAGVPEDLLNADDEAIGRNSSEAAQLFKSGLQMLRAGDFEGSIKAFDSFVQTYPDTAFTDNAFFWAGIAKTKLGLYDRAIVSFSEVFQRFPAEDRVAPALYYLAEAFLKLGSREDARLTLEKLISDHPKSSYAGLASKKMRDLKLSRGRR